MIGPDNQEHEYDFSDDEAFACELCGASPMTAMCNNGRCDDVPHTNTQKIGE